MWWLTSLAWGTPNSWAPPGAMTLPDTGGLGWRAASVFEDVREFQVAVGPDRELYIAALTHTGITVKRLEEDAWATAHTLDRAILFGSAFAFAVDERGLLFAIEDDGFHVIRDGREVAQCPSLSEPVLGMGVEASHTIVAITQDDFFVHTWMCQDGAWSLLGDGPSKALFESTGGALRIHAWKANDLGYEPMSIWPRAAPATPHSFVRSLPVFAASSGDMSFESWPAYTSTHYGGESTRALVRRGTTVLSEQGDYPLILPDTFTPTVLDLASPMLVFFANETVYAARWDGESWWGVGQPHRADHGMGGTREVDAWQIRMPSRNRIEAIVNDRNSGPRLAVWTVDEGQWALEETQLPQPDAPSCDPDEQSLSRVLSLEAQRVVVESTCNGSFDRISTGQWPTRSFERTSHPPLSQPDMPLQMTGSKKRSAIVGNAVWFERRGSWQRDPAFDALGLRRALSLGVRGQRAWVLGLTGGAYVVATRSNRRWSTRPITGLEGYVTDAVATAERLDVVVDNDGDTALWTVNTTTGAAQRVRSLDARYPHDIRIAYRPDRTRILAYLAGGEAFVFGEDMKPLAADGRVVGNVSAYDLMVDDTGVCIAYIAPDIRTRRIGVLCHE